MAMCRDGQDGVNHAKWPGVQRPSISRVGTLLLELSGQERVDVVILRRRAARFCMIRELAVDNLPSATSGVFVVRTVALTALLRELLEMVLAIRLCACVSLTESRRNMIICANSPSTSCSTSWRLWISTTGTESAKFRPSHPARRRCWRNIHSTKASCPYTVGSFPPSCST